MKKHLLVLIALLVALVAVAAVASATEIPGDREFIQYGEIDTVTKIGGHTVTAVEIVKEPTCTDFGMVKFYCDTPHAGETTSSHALYIYALDHMWSSEYTYLNWGKVIKDAKCNEPGLAIDYCLRCGLENPDVSREIIADHVYDEDHSQVVYAPTCTENGWAVHTCIYCGQWNPLDKADWDYVLETKDWSFLENSHLIKLKMVKHAWTGWNITEESTCYEYGEAKRACEVCGATQELNEYQTEVLDQGNKITIDQVIPLKNAHWEDEVVAKLQGETFASENTLNGAMSYIKHCQFVVVEDKLEGCYARQITVACPYCKDDLIPEHEEVTYTLVYPMTAAHEWKLCEELSTPATCTEDGVDVYLCIHDDFWAYEYGVPYHVHPQTIGDFTDPAVLEVPTSATGHTWGEWKVVDKYLNEKGETVVREVRACEACHATENRVHNEGEEPVKDGLVKGEDGKWYYYKNDVWQSEYTGFVTFQGGQFWVTEGVVDTSLNGLINCPGDKWLFFAQGQVQKVTQMAEYAGQWFMIKNGELDVSANGLYDYDGGKFAFAAGRLLKETNGIWQNPKDHVWYFLSQGQLQKYTGTATYDGATFELVDGVLVVK